PAFRQSAANSSNRYAENRRNLSIGRMPAEETKHRCELQRFRQTSQSIFNFGWSFFQVELRNFNDFFLRRITIEGHDSSSPVTQFHQAMIAQNGPQPTCQCIFIL